MTLAIHIWVNRPNLLKVLSRLLMSNNSQSMPPFLYSDHRLLLSASTFADCCPFLNVTIEDANVVPQSLWHYDTLTLWYSSKSGVCQKWSGQTYIHTYIQTWHHNKISKACQAKNMTHDSKSVNLTHFWRLNLQPFFMEHISLTWLPMKNV
jgi:hypothetical protein